jgi:hypothetical protein
MPPKKKTSKKKVRRKRKVKKEVDSIPEEFPVTLPLPTNIPCAICGSTNGIHPSTCYQHYALKQHEKED